MANPLIEARVLFENQEARTLHADGLTNALAGRFDDAQELFRAAQEALSVDPLTLDRTVQAARITRDSGFTWLRAAIAAPENDTPAVLAKARDTLDSSRHVTKESLTNPPPASYERPSGLSTRRARRETWAEHGETLSLLGRLGTAHAVLLPSDSSKESPSTAAYVNNSPHYYQLAHNALIAGNNGYYRVSNALAAARDARINQHRPDSAEWAARAAVGLAWTAMRDPQHLVAAARTTANRARDLRNPQAAQASVLARP